MDRQDRQMTTGRRSASRATKLRRRKQRMNALLLIGAVAAILWLVFVLPVWLGLPSPFAELRRAVRTIGTESGDVEEITGLDSAYDIEPQVNKLLHGNILRLPLPRFLPGNAGVSKQVDMKVSEVSEETSEYLQSLQGLRRKYLYHKGFRT